jgi:nucleotide-binding universal stress UspA family protein
MIKHVLVAVGANGSDAALALAIERARDNRARLSAIHVVDRMPWWASASIEHDCDRVFAHIEAQARKHVEHAAKSMREAGIEGTCITVDLPGGSTLARAIARAARELDADLIVVGRSKRALWRIWEERVSNAVSRHSNRRVLIATDDGDLAETKATPLSYTIVDSTQRPIVETYR